MVEIIPAILTSDESELKAMISRLEGVVKRVQIDIIDTTFAKNETVKPNDFAGIKTDLLLDFHLMVTEPKDWIKSCFEAGADRVIGQIEMMESQEEFVEGAHKKGLKAGLALDLATPVENLDIEVSKKLDVVLVMSVPAGLGGQEFNESVLPKIVDLKKIRQEIGADFRICDDGGVTFETVDDVHYFGVEEVSIGRRLFKGSIEENLKKFQEAAHKVN